MKNTDKEFPIIEDRDRRLCPFCKASFKNIRIHFKRKKHCGDKIDMHHFIKIHEAITLEKRREQIRISVQKQKLNLKAKDAAKFDEDNRKAAAKSKQKKKNENPGQFSEDNRKAAAKSKQKRKK